MNPNKIRQVILDTETTGLESKQGHRIIEIGCVEIINRRKTDNSFHQYLNPAREIEDGAFDVHGLSNEFLTDKPLFADIAQDFIDFVRDSEVIIHNAPFDIAFIDADKTNYINYYESVIKLINKDGLIIIDNVLWHGEVADENNNDKFTNIIRKFNTHIKDDDRVEQMILPIGDGLTICRKL